MPLPDSPILERFRAVRLLVVGDLILDHHVFGRVERISPEAPVPVLLVESERLALGGAGNVAANAAALGARVILIGAVGEDGAASDLVRLVRTDHPGIEPRLVTLRGRPTVMKTRFRGGQHQLVRVDRENTAPLPSEAETALIEEIEDAIDEVDLVVLSDYSKGVLGDRVLGAALDLAGKAGKPVVVDPKRRDFSAYRGAALIMPNRRELTQAVGLPCDTDEEARVAAEAAIAASGAAILLKRSQKGASLFRPDAAPLHMPAEAHEVYDVNGAGDTVVAGVALAMGAGLPFELALRIGNAAAGIAVSKIGTTVVSPEELTAALRTPGRAGAAAAQPLASLERALAQRDRWRAEGLVVGFTNGCFDLVHSGHVALIGQAAAACDRLIVALNSDASVRRLKGQTRPVQKLDARAAVMSGLKGVDLVVSFEEDTPIELIRALQPDVLVKGADYKEDQVVGGDLVKAWGGRVVLAHLVEGQSTTEIVKRART